jgi:putative hemolysin
MALRTGARQPFERRIDRHGASAMAAAGVGNTKKDAGSSICAHVGLLDDFAVVCREQGVRSPYTFLTIEDW